MDQPASLLLPFGLLSVFLQQIAEGFINQFIDAAFLAYRKNADVFDHVVIDTGANLTLGFSHVVVSHDGTVANTC